MVSGAVRPGVYVGTLRHRRMAPIAHEFTYPLFMVFLDIDRIPEFMGKSTFTSYNRWNWASFHEADHLGDPALPLRTRLARDASRYGFSLPDGPVFLLTHLRYLGYGFNPVSFFYCYDQGGALRLVLAEVNNTFGGSHNYWLEPSGGAQDGPFRAAASKSFYVSPFMPADMRYAFTFSAPADRLVAHMTVDREPSGDGTAHRFDATLRLEHRDWSAAMIRSVLLRHPAMTVSVVAGIHWQALRLWWKGLPVVPRPTRDGVHPEHAAPDAGRL